MQTHRRGVAPLALSQLENGILRYSPRDDDDSPPETRMTRYLASNAAMRVRDRMHRMPGGSLNA